MMRVAMSAFLAVVVLLLGTVSSPQAGLSQTLSIARVRKSNGKVVEGVIPGVLLLKSAAIETVEGAKKIRTVAYVSLPGGSVMEVDASGVRSRGDAFLLCVAASEAALPGDLELATHTGKHVRSVARQHGLGFSTIPLPNGVIVLLGVDPERGTSDETVDMAVRIAKDFNGPPAAAAARRLFEIEREIVARRGEESKRAGGPSLTFHEKLVGMYRFEGERDQLLPSLVVETTRGPVTVPLAAIGRR